jgi:hypothetical protein
MKEVYLPSERHLNLQNLFPKVLIYAPRGRDLPLILLEIDA